MLPSELYVAIGDGSSATLDGCGQACSSGAAFVPHRHLNLSDPWLGAQGPREVGLLVGKLACLRY